MNDEKDLEELVLLVRDKCKDPIERANALTDLFEHPEINQLIIDVLMEDEVKSSLRNTAIFLIEHLEFSDQHQKTALKERLLYHAKKISDEELVNHRSKFAQEAAIRKYACQTITVDQEYFTVKDTSLVDNALELIELAPFLENKYTMRVRLIALLGIKNVFFKNPPAPEMASKMQNLYEKIISVAETCLSEDFLKDEKRNDQFDLGLAAYEALLFTGNNKILSLTSRLVGFGRWWIVRHESKHISNILKYWNEKEIKVSEEQTNMLKNSLEAFNDYLKKK